MITAIRLTLKVARLESLLLGVLCMGFTAVALLLSAQLTALIQSCPPTRDLTRTSCDSSAFSNAAELGRVLMAGFGVMPLFVGAVLGSSMIAREIEQGTAELAWSLAGSRRRWFVERLAIMSGLVLVLLLPGAWTAHVLEGAIEFASDPNSSALDLGARGVGLLVRGVAAFAAAVAIGSVLGRVLPALLASLAPALAVLSLATPIATLGMAPVVIGPLGLAEIATSIVLERKYQGPSGALVTQEQAFDSVPAGQDAEDWIVEHFTPVAVGIPGRSYPELEARSGLVLTAASSVLLLASLKVVGRRRPY